MKLVVCVVLLIVVLNGEEIGMVFSGAGARLAQEAALAKVLMEGTYPNGGKVMPTVIAGASAGCLNAVAVNAIIKTDRNGGVGFSWKDYEEILFGVTDGSIFDDTPLGIIEIMTYNIEHGYLLDPTPLRNLILNCTTRMGYQNFGDLTVPTVISVLDKATGNTLRLRSDDPRYSSINIVDIVMASAAIPIAFPSVYIPEMDMTFIDGSTGQDEIPIYELIHGNFTKFDRVYIIAREFYYGPEYPDILKHLPIVVNVIETIEFFLQGLYTAGLEEASFAPFPVYQYIPQLPDHYGMFSFGQQKIQYQQSTKWALSHNPTLIN